MFSSILVVCTGNICRSPMAERMLADRLASNAINVSSAGTAALVGHPAQPHVEDVLSSHGLTAARHRARQMHSSMLRAADLILVMERHHRHEIATRFPMVHGRTYLVGHWRDQEVPDPYMQPLSAYEQTWNLLELCLDDWIAKIQASAS